MTGRSAQITTTQRTNDQSYEIVIEPRQPQRPKARGRRETRTANPIKLTEDLILQWADAHAKRYGRWPFCRSREPVAAPSRWNLTWQRIDNALRSANYGLPRRTTLSRLLEQRKPFSFYLVRPTEAELFKMIRRHYRLTGQWPHKHSGRLASDPDKNWQSIDAMLVRDSRREGMRITLADIVAKARGIPNPRNLAPLSVEQVLQWADDFRQKTGRWPQRKKHRHLEPAPDITWFSIDTHLRRGTRGLPAVGGLASFLDKHRNVRNKADAPPVTINEILAWADEHHERTGQWPSSQSGPVHDVPNENWMSLNEALKFGRRGLRTRTTLANLLAKHRGKPHPFHLPKLTERKILQWANAHFKHTGAFPYGKAGLLIDQPGEKWSAIDAALQCGSRGLPGGDTLRKLLTRKCKRYGQLRNMPLKRLNILEWAAEHHERTGKLPTARSGKVRDQLGESWDAIDASLRAGTRNMLGGSSLAEFLDDHYRPEHRALGRRLTEDMIWQWAQDFRGRVGRWPTTKSAYTDPSRSEKWSLIDEALRKGHRGLPGGSSLRKLIQQRKCKA